MKSDWPTLSVAVVAVIHVAIMGLEMIPPEHPVLLKQLEPALGFRTEGPCASPIVLNAGLFNGLLAAGLFWGCRSRVNPVQIRAFFLTCVIVAGVFGALTLSWLTVPAQMLPAAVALLLNTPAARRGSALNSAAVPP